MEVERFWGRRASWAAGSFFLVRYLALLGHVPILYEFYGPQVQSVSRAHAPSQEKPAG